MASYRIHNIRFYSPEPKSATCLCHEPKTKKLALARNDNSIEIWNVENAPFVECTIAAHAENSVESILWIGPRLFSTGLQGAVIEYDLLTLGSKYKVMVIGGAAWCMDVNHEKTLLAVGTEDGYINTFNVYKDKLIYERIFDKQKGRILCIKWDNTGEMIYTGSTDTIRVWSVISGHAIHKMTTSRSNVRKNTIVWCLAVTDDNIIISGDSHGFLCFWDPHIGVLIESHESHTADILAITLSHDMNIVYCAGVDPVVRTFCKVTLKSSGKSQWVKGIERRLHIHDVRALLETNGKLYSAGVDGYLAVSSYPPKNLVKYPPLLQSPCATICRKSRCILLRYTNYLELWRLGSITKDPPELIRSSMLHQLDEEPIKLLQLQAKGDESIISCAINKDSKTIVYSTDTHVRVFNFDVIEGDALLSRNDADLSMNRVQKMLFSPNGKLFITINNDGDENTVTLFRVDKKSLRLIGSFNTTKESITNVGLVCFSPDNKYLIFTDRQCGIAVYFIGNGITAESLKSWRLPKYSCPATAIAVQKGTLNLVVVYSDHKIIEYNIPTRQYTMFSNSLQNYLPKHWLARPFPITNIIFDPHNENIIIMQDDSSVYVINKNSELPEKEAKIPKRENGENTEDSNSISSSQSQHAFQVAKKYKHLVYLNWLNDEELIAVEVNPTSLSEKLPPTLKQKFFGM
ncbi:U3 small nucleolar RNA-associated protein 4 homolog [Camponotus floridanus]|uniref:U3 small nucleolar RNA-associated protein 4 homolog n=1 Tax=Camponotus floridanus TaxID=104421 RepID=UPI00059CE2CA|nr:U3 small nucleolar RNA-associated protein 4 homolog [Camponotus floridanus]XP_011263500.1 U3 small nucleolar RNA-associated protein 4 homolog [Camponotus floridanus]